MNIKELIKDSLEKLAEDRPIFHSEADFQFALAIKLKEMWSPPDLKYRMKKGKLFYGNNLSVIVDGVEQKMIK